MSLPVKERSPFVIVIIELDNLLLNNYWRRYYTYMELGWDQASIEQYILKKESMLKIASFTSPKINFTASNRQDQYFKIYNRPDLLEKDVAMQDAVAMINSIVQDAYCVSLSSRPINQQDLTIAVMRRQGFPVDLMEFHFAQPNESIMNFRNRTFSQLQKRFVLGFGICLTASDAIGFDRLKFPTIALTTLKEPQDLEGLDATCADWNQVAQSLIGMISSIPKKRVVEAQAKLDESNPKRIQAKFSVETLAAHYSGDAQLAAPTVSIPHPEINPAAVTPISTPIAAKPTPNATASTVTSVTRKISTPKPAPLDSQEEVPLPKSMPTPAPTQPITKSQDITDELAALGDLLNEPLLSSTPSAGAAIPSPSASGYSKAESEPELDLSVFDDVEARSQTQVVLDQAISYQLFSGTGTDRILGTDQNTSIQIENVEALLNAFMAELKPRLSLIKDNKIGDFFAYFTKRFQLNLQEVQSIVESNLAGMQGVNSDENAAVFMVVTKLVEQLRNITFEHFGIGWIGWIFYETIGQQFTGIARQKFDRLLNNNDPDVGLLYNVSFVLWLANIFPDVQYSEQIQEVIKNHAKR